MLLNGFSNLNLNTPSITNGLPSLQGMTGGMTPPDSGGDKPAAPAVTSDNLQKWNKLIQFMKDKGYAGNPQLDHDPALRQKVFDEYNKANPNDTVTQDMVQPIQNEIQTYKQKALSDIKANPDTFPGKPEDFMKGISQVDGIFGQKTSQWQFPSAYIDAKKTKSVGFANQVDRQKLTQMLTNK